MRESTLPCYNFKVDHPVLVPSNNGNGNRRNQDQTCTRQSPATTRQKETTQESDASSSINTVEIVSSNDILHAALRPFTILKYKTYSNYCMQNNISHMQPKIGELLDYFTHLYNSGASYSVFNSSKNALSHIVFLPPYSSISEHPQITKYFKGVFNLRPPTGKITFAWDIKLLFDYFNYKGENDQLSDKSLTQKLLILLLLLGGQRMNTVYFFTVDRMTVTDIGVTFSPNYVLKHSKPGKKLDSFHYRAYNNKKVMCCRLFKRIFEAS